MKFLKYLKVLMNKDGKEEICDSIREEYDFLMAYDQRKILNEKVLLSSDVTLTEVNFVLYMIVPAFFFLVIEPILQIAPQIFLTNINIPCKCILFAIFAIFPLICIYKMWELRLRREIIVQMIENARNHQ